MDRRYGEPFADLLCQPCLPECFIPIAGNAARKIGPQDCLPSVRYTLIRGCSSSLWALPSHPFPMAVSRRSIC
jgi:hypothetical protein